MLWTDQNERRFLYESVAGTGPLQDLRHRRDCRAGAEGRELLSAQGRICGRGGRERFRQEHSAQSAGRAGHPYLRQGAAGRAGFVCHERAGAHHLPPPEHRLCVSGVQPDPGADRGAEYPVPGIAGLPEAGHGVSGRIAGCAGPPQAAQSPARPAFRRAAAARGHRAGAHHPSGADFSR